MVLGLKTTINQVGAIELFLRIFFGIETKNCICDVQHFSCAKFSQPIRLED